MEILNLFRVFGEDTILEVVAVDEDEAVRVACEDAAGFEVLQIEYMQATPHLDNPGIYGEILL